MKLKRITCLTGIGLLLLSVGMVSAADSRLSIFVSILPQAYFVEKIGEDFVSVEVLVPPGESPAIFAPTPAIMSRLVRADIFFTVGVPFETALVPKIVDMAGHLEIVDTRQGIALRRMASASHEEDDAHHHDVGGYDPHIWMNPLLVKQQAQTITETLCRRDPGHSTVYRENGRRFKTELDALHRKIAAALAPVKGEPMFVFHPAFGYLADAYGLHQVAVEMEGKAPKGRELVRFVERARQNNARVIFVQPQFDVNTADKIARMIDGAVVPLNPLAKDYINNLGHMAEQIRQGLSQGRGHVKDGEKDLKKTGKLQ